MTPGEFSLANAIEIVPDWRRRELGEHARQAAEHGGECSVKAAETYWDGVYAEHERIVWRDAYDRRLARLERMKANNPKGTGNGSRKTTGDTRQAADR